MEVRDRLQNSVLTVRREFLRLSVRTSSSALSDDCESVVVTTTLQLGAIRGVGGIFSLRGVMRLDEVFTSCLLMIPNLFILG